MKINNIQSNLSFGSNYRFTVTTKNFSEAMDAADILAEKEFKDKEFKAHATFTPFQESLETGVYQKIHISSPNRYDEYIESVLKQRNIPFTKQSKNDAIKLENIYDRIVLGQYPEGKMLVSLNTEKVEKLFKENQDSYISYKGQKGAIGNRYKGVLEFLLTGRDIEATKLYLSERENKLHLEIYDGRHRFAVMRDIGMPRIKFEMDEESFLIAQKYNLID
ncbi:hypothetical protein IJD44_08000 [bacterium]|nr:hypothetical protein [bacterium]